jgi:uncharacterized membrane protein YjgN (DUF898 family)
MAEPCPRCSALVDSERCPRCGLVIALYHAAREKLRRGPAAPPPAAALAVSSATGAAPATGPAGPAPRGDAPRPAAPRGLLFHGSAWTLFGMHIVNVFLTLLTLGVFYFWGKARVRAYLHSQSELERDRFAYHGTGLELLTGFVKGLIVFGIPVVLLSVVPQVLRVHPAVSGALQTLLWLLGVFLVPVAMVGARRYRLSRTSWRGIRFSFRGSVREFVGIFVLGSILTSLTLGIYYPVFATQRQGFMISHAYFGSRTFDFDARGRVLIGPFLVMALLFLPTLGLSWFWFSARRHRYFTEHTRFGATRFRSAVGGGALAWLQVTNLLAIVLTLGLAWPWTVARGVRFYYRLVTVEGPLDLAGVQQEARAASATGEGLAGLLDADFGVS